MWFVIPTLMGPVLLSMLSILYFQGAGENENEWKLSDKSTEFNLKLTEIEKNGIKRFRELVDDILEKDYEKSDDFLVRWLRDCKMDIQAANKMLRKAKQWRLENEIDEIMNKTFLPLRHQPCFVDGFDKGGGPVLIYRLKGVDMRKLIIGGHAENMLHHSDQCVEKFIHTSIRKTIANKDIKISMTAGITLVDSDGYNIKQHACFGCLKLYRQLATHSNLFYPQSSKLVVIINVPSIGKPVIDMIRPFLSPFFQKTLRVFGVDKGEWSSYLLSVIPKDELLQEYGGTKARATSMINQGQ